MLESGYIEIPKIKGKSKRVPIKVAKEIADKYNKDQVLIFCYDALTGTLWQTTYGKTRADCYYAKKAAETIRKTFGIEDEKQKVTI